MYFVRALVISLVISSPLPFFIYVFILVYRDFVISSFLVFLLPLAMASFL